MGKCFGKDGMSRKKANQPFQLQEEDSPSTTFGIVGDRQEQTELHPDSKSKVAQ